VKRADQQLAVLARVVLQRRRARVSARSFAADKGLSFADFLKAVHKLKSINYEII
jgi:hypothetical protein